MTRQVLVSVKQTESARRASKRFDLASLLGRGSDRVQETRAADWLGPALGKVSNRLRSACEARRTGREGATTASASTT